MKRFHSGLLSAIVIATGLAPTGAQARLPAGATSRPYIETRVVCKARTPLEVRVLGEIRRQYDTLSRAYSDADSTTILRQRTAGYSVDNGRGNRTDAAAMKQALRIFFQQARPPIRIGFTIEAAETLSAKRAVLTIFQQGCRYQSLIGVERWIEHDVTERETWIRGAAGWRFHATDSIRDRHRWVDGKAIDPDRPYDPEAPPFVGR